MKKMKKIPTYKSNILREYVEALDLKGLVEPVIGIDMFDSKVGENDEVIVVDFEVATEAAGNDIVTFMDSSVIEMIDVEVSPAPGPNGKYRVFFEFMRDVEFAKKLLGVLQDMVRLTGPVQWKIQSLHDNKNIVPLSVDEFKKINYGPQE